MDVRLLRFAVTLADELHFGRAARAHFIAEPAFGRHIKRLERAVGSQLFERTSRRVAVTPVGVRFIAEARDVVAAFDRLGAPAPDDDSPTIRLGVLGFGLAGWWPLVRDEVERAIGEVEIDFVELDFATEHSLLRAGLIDVGLVQDYGVVDGIDFTPIGSVPLVLVAPRGSRTGALRRASMADLAGERWLDVFGRLSWSINELNSHARDSRHCLVRSPASVPSAVATTGHVSLHSEAAREYFPHPEIRYVPFDGPPTTIGVAVRIDERRSRVLAFREAAARVALLAGATWRGA